MGHDGPGGPGRPASPRMPQPGDDDPGRGGNSGWEAQLTVPACTLISVFLHLVTWINPSIAVAAGEHSPTGGNIAWGHKDSINSALGGTGVYGAATHGADNDENGGIDDEPWRPDVALLGTVPHDGDAIARLKRLQRELFAGMVDIKRRVDELEEAGQGAGEAGSDDRFSPHEGAGQDSI